MAILGLYNNLSTYLIIAAFLFAMGIYGIIARRTFIAMLIAAEMILAGAALNFMAFNRFTSPDPVTGQIFTLFIMAIAAAEAAIGLSIVIAIYRQYDSIDAEDVVQLKG
ncbi:NADH-quinone oxidoreductase subunit NuoK [Desulforhopalus sp. IMCC35007]|uniref:NADH-quinone oxidoreductase subunit NuoK n=1 Tax=Desulforhopalus sp. IMCC35007 TaxID=2569543 RepID=UPI0010AE78EE|nr:NADH-quinone oxidoreductase subunit NuoK [Desulforhopalus sp. IMCC35007]TKB08041.1 NADH-quinone oxidoreductase subunit NuoK [Desulforhopalus sp. IMCC35007]